MHIQRFPKGQMWLYGGVDRISTVSQAIVDGITDERPETASRIKLIGNPVDLGVFHPGSEGSAASDRGPARILYTGRIHPEKGLHLLVEAWGRLRAAEVEAQGACGSVRRLPTGATQFDSSRRKWSLIIMISYDFYTKMNEVFQLEKCDIPPRSENLRHSILLTKATNL